MAEGFGPFFGGVAEMSIIDDDAFAIRNLDYYPVFSAWSQAEIDAEMLAGQLSGVNHAAGLRWPRVQGRRNGHDYWYSASLPVITRDVVNFCEAPNAYYRLPFAQDDLSWTQGQGNHPEASQDSGYTHAGGYAYDMLAPLGTPILAARAGRVVQIEESLTVQCAPGQCNPNNIFVMHQDGSIGEYAHMPMNSVIPQVGDLVKRGEQLAVIGVVGPTTGPHLHFATRYGAQARRRDLPGPVRGALSVPAHAGFEVLRAAGRRFPAVEQRQDPLSIRAAPGRPESGQPIWSV